MRNCLGIRLVVFCFELRVWGPKSFHGNIAGVRNQGGWNKKYSVCTHFTDVEADLRGVKCSAYLFFFLP